jgi:hypothetical protein
VMAKPAAPPQSKAQTCRQSQPFELPSLGAAAVLRRNLPKTNQ